MTMMCEAFTDPRTQCGCLDSREFFGLFPAWATKDDIAESIPKFSWPVRAEPEEPQKPKPRP